ncbi:hypothetical protein [Streptomyces cyaneofuscatus]|uniref:hypothetical protein n=1 Tax=Streptomyces cyaneofuscatus TaxID=66883 RepID=UPI003442F9F9
MFRKRAMALASFAAVGVLMLSACGGSEDSAANPGGAAAEAGGQGNAIDLSFNSGTAKENNADPKTGDLAPDAAPAVAKKPVVRKWVQLSAGQAGDLNPVIVNGAGFTLYRFDNDTANPSKSNCSGDCATTWPPYLVAPGGKVFLDNIKASAVGFIKRPDGNFQVTVGGWPTYLFSKDTKPGDTNGQGVGGTWFGVTPDGERAGAPQGGDSGGNGGGEAPQLGNSVIIFDEANFSENGAAQGLSGPGCQNVRRGSSFGSLSADGAIKIWEGENCTGKVQTVQGQVPDLAAIGMTTIRSVRFAG